MFDHAENITVTPYVSQIYIRQDPSSDLTSPGGEPTVQIAELLHFTPIVFTKKRDRPWANQRYILRGPFETTDYSEK